ncbi:hypothetical protein [Thiobacillus sp.]|jgi:hypothetical protein|uniref:hypothetical protein n=1 Tax=Thiobacillus sp. TaxID=924 RepID=UPI0025D1E7C4|nr:hypothetical protein [Thiobacillus sp.]
MPVVLFQLGALVRGNRVLQRQRMQAEFLAKTGDGLAVRRFQFDPDESIRLSDVVADVVECDGLGFGIGEEQAVDGELQQRGTVVILGRVQVDGTRIQDRRALSVIVGGHASRPRLVIARLEAALATQ